MSHGWIQYNYSIDEIERWSAPV